MAYEINININGDYEESDGVSKSPSEADKKLENYQKRMSKYIASQTIQPFIQEVKTQVTQNIGVMTGRTELQERINAGFSAVQTGINTYKNAQMGATLTTGLGLGGGVGVALGIALSTLEIGMNILFKQMEINLNAYQEELRLSQTRKRMGAYTKSRSN